MEHWNLQDRRIELLMLALYTDIEEGASAGRLYGESIGTALSVYLTQKFAVFRPKTASYHGGIPSARLKRVTEHIEAHLERTLPCQPWPRSPAWAPIIFASCSSKVCTSAPINMWFDGASSGQKATFRIPTCQ